MSNFPWIRFSLASATLVGLGYMIMRATVPSDEQLYNEMAPDLRRKVDATRAARLAREAEAKSEVKPQTGTTDLAADATKPKWADKPPSR